jgi:hypothetical protein
MCFRPQFMGNQKTWAGLVGSHNLVHQFRLHYILHPAKK